MIAGPLCGCRSYQCNNKISIIRGINIIETHKIRKIFKSIKQDFAIDQSKDIGSFFFITINHQLTIQNYYMEQTLNFLSIIDNRLKRSHHHKLQALSLKEKPQHKKHSYRYPYARAIDFTESKYSEFPKWLIEKDGFVDFMYRNYENKIMSIPKICEKEVRASDEKYFVSLFLSQIHTFKDLPTVVNQVILDNLKTRYYAQNDVVHFQGESARFIGIVYLGEVEYRLGKRTVLKQKNDVILLQAFHEKSHPEIVCKEEAIILTIDKNLFPMIRQRLKAFIEQQERDLIDDFLKSTFFTQLHIKESKLKAFFNDLQLDFYLPEEVIQEAGTHPTRFYLLFKGELREQNQIFVKEHNKWPLSNSKWEVRAVYNSYNKSEVIRPHRFFCDEEILDNLKLKSKFSSSTWAIVFTMKADRFVAHLNSQDLKRLKKYRAEHVETDYGALQQKVREKVKSNTERKRIVLKAINTVLVSKTEFSPRKLKLIKDFEQSMLRRPFFAADRTVI